MYITSLGIKPLQNTTREDYAGKTEEVCKIQAPGNVR